MSSATYFPSVVKACKKRQIYWSSNSKVQSCTAENCFLKKKFETFLIIENKTKIRGNMFEVLKKQHIDPTAIYRK